VHAAPALRELMMMGKIFHEVERRAAPQWDVVVTEMPASGQALGMIGMPLAARETFGSNMVGREAAAVARLLRDSAQCAIIIVTTADALALKETLEIHQRLDAWKIATAAIVLNRLSGAAFTAVDIARMREHGAETGNGKQIEVLVAIARAELKRRTRERRFLNILKRGIGAPIVQLSEEPIATEPLAVRLAERLASSPPLAPARLRR
jgi:anion-transporting  ArsA/GET3 family ATPase